MGPVIYSSAPLRQVDSSVPLGPDGGQPLWERHRLEDEEGGTANKHLPVSAAVLCLAFSSPCSSKYQVQPEAYLT